MTAFDIPQLQEKYAELKHDMVVMQNENTLRKRKCADLEYKLESHLKDHEQKAQAYNFMKSLAELGDAPEEDEAWAHLQAGD